MARPLRLQHIQRYWKKKKISTFLKFFSEKRCMLLLYFIWNTFQTPTTFLLSRVCDTFIYLYLFKYLSRPCDPRLPSYHHILHKIMQLIHVTTLADRGPTSIFVGTRFGLKVMYKKRDSVKFQYVCYTCTFVYRLYCVCVV